MDDVVEYEQMLKWINDLENIISIVSQMDLPQLPKANIIKVLKNEEYHLNHIMIRHLGEESLKNIKNKLSKVS